MATRKESLARPFCEPLYLAAQSPSCIHRSSSLDLVDLGPSRYRAVYGTDMDRCPPDDGETEPASRSELHPISQGQGMPSAEASDPVMKTVEIASARSDKENDDPYHQSPSER